MNLRDTLERLFWTMLVAFLGTVTGSAVLGLDMAVWQAGLVAAISAGFNFITLVGRARLAVLPDPGAGLPGLPTEGDAGH